MKHTICFNLPEENNEFKNAIKGSDYINAIRDIVEWLKRESDISEEMGTAYELSREEVFTICEGYGFSPWED